MTTSDTINLQAFHALPGSADLQQALAALGLAGAWPQVIVDIEKSGGSPLP